MISVASAKSAVSTPSKSASGSMERDRHSPPLQRRANPECVPRIREIFAQLDQLTKGEHSQRNRMLVMREFGEFFDVGIELPKEGQVPLLLSPKKHDENAQACHVPAPGMDWDPRTTDSWHLHNNRLTAQVHDSADWRSLMAASTLPAARTSFFTVTVHSLRTLAIGVVQGGTPPRHFVGDSVKSWGYQSTGHMLHGGGVFGEGVTAPTFDAGDRIGVLVDPSQNLLVFYRNGRLSGSPFLGVDPSEGLHICISAHLGPCTFSVDAEPLGEDPAHGAVICPVFIGGDSLVKTASHSYRPGDDRKM